VKLLNRHWFRPIEQFLHIAEKCLLDRNEQRPQNGLSGLPPKQFMHTVAADCSSELAASRGTHDVGCLLPTFHSRD
jgi:hypothetical protein